MTLWDRIDELRRAQHLSIKELAEAAGISEPGYYSRKRGDTLEVRTLLAFAKVLRVDAVDLIPRKEQPGQLVSDPPAHYGRQYLEDRVAFLETQMRELRTDVKRLKQPRR